MTPNWSRMCMYNVPLGLITRARRAVSSGIVSGSGGGNDITHLLSTLQTAFTYITRYPFLFASFDYWATESMLVLGQERLGGPLMLKRFSSYFLQHSLMPRYSLHRPPEKRLSRGWIRLKQSREWPKPRLAGRQSDVGGW